MQKQIIVKVCNEPACEKKGAGGIMKKIEQAFGLLTGTKNDKCDLNYCACLGCCDFGPNILVNNNLVMSVNKENVMEKITETASVVAPTQKEKEDNLNKVLAEDILGDLI